MKFLPTVCLGATLVFTLAACGGDELRDGIAADLQAAAQGMISESEAECAADVIIDVLGRDNARLYASATTGDLEAASQMERITTEQQQAMADGFDECDFGAMQP